MPIENIVWILPRPRKSKYPGGFPLHFEKKLLRLYDNPKLILHPFGGHAEFGIRCDIRTSHELKDGRVIPINPDVVCDAHNLPFSNNTFDFVIVDPPYSNEESAEMYKTGKLFPSKYVVESVRVCKPGGYIALYHKVMLPRPKGTFYDRRVFVGTRNWHKPRICCIFRKAELGEVYQ